MGFLRAPTSHTVLYRYPVSASVAAVIVLTTASPINRIHWSECVLDPSSSGGVFFVILSTIKHEWDQFRFLNLPRGEGIGKDI